MFSVHVEIFILMPECTCWGFMYFYGIWAHLHLHYAWVPTCFSNFVWVFVCGTAIHVLFFTFWNPFEIRFGHSSWLVDIRNEACMGSSHSRSWFSFLVVPLESFVLSIATKKSHLHLHSIVPHPPRNRAHPQNPSSFTLHTIHSHHPSHPPSSHLHYSPPAWRPMHIATIILSL